MNLKSELKKKFVIDAMLGNIAKKLRILGFDSYYFSKSKDEDLLQIALDENRILITKDSQLIQKALKSKIRTVFLSDEPETKQFLQIKNELNLPKLKITMDNIRCSICNNKIISIKKDLISDMVPNGVLENNDEFWKCMNCNKVYWKGTHINNLQQFVDTINEL